MSAEAVRNFFTSKGADVEIITLDDSLATVDEAAAAIGVDGDVIAKTLSFQLADRVAIVVMSGRSRIDNRKYKETFGEKARMLPHEDVERLTGHPAGGVCPFGLDPSIDICLDQSLERHPVVYPAAGERNNAVKMTPQEIADVTGGRWVDVCK